MADYLISTVKYIGECILTQCVWPLMIKPHFDYWWCFDSNIQGLRDGINKLEPKKSSIEQEIESFRLLTHIPCPEVEEWLKASTEKLEKARRISQDANIPKAWDIRSRYSLGKNAKETAAEIAELLSAGDLIQRAYPPPSAAMAYPAHGSSMDFESRKGIEEDIIKSLKESSVDMIGICGMGGVGKTTMAQRIWKRVKDENLCDEVVMVTVSQKIDIPKIQSEIAELLKLKIDESSVSARAHQLRTRLLDAKSKIIIFDDVWESLKFGDLGIPIESNFERCKVLLTSRSIDTCKPIKNKKVFELKSLQEEEAWILFKEKAGKCVEDSALRSVAKFVAEECKGLPIALVTVGLALQDETDIHTWNFSLSKLKESNPTDLPEVMAGFYQPLKLSYDKLDTDGDKCFFLLCCLFHEDYDISVEELTWYSMGLKMFDDISIKEATNRAHTLVGKLKRRFLLIDGRDELHVKMHDVIRDVAIYIGSKEKNGFLKSLTSIKNSSDSSDVNCNWMSVDISNEGMEVPVLSRFPKLRLLMLCSDYFYNISHMSFEGMKELNVLSFERASIGSLPPTLGSLENLQTLCLFHCRVKNISVVGKLTSLKILICYECKNIKELPGEIGSLSGLRLLELSYCNLLQTIPFGVISSLTRLEELKMRRSFNRWEAEENGKETRNASLKELERLLNLTCLEIDIPDCTLSTQEICLEYENLVKYYIRIGSLAFLDDNGYYDVGSRDYEKVMILKLPSDIGAVGQWIKKGVRNTEWLCLEGDGCGSNNFNIAEIENLRNLIVDSCSTLKKLVETKDCKFHNLKSIEICKCDNLRSLFSVSAARRCLLQLEDLRIEFCESMEQVFWNEGTDDNTYGCIEFPKLKLLRLWDLPNLIAFWQGLENIIIKFPNLTEMRIGGLPKLNSLCPLNSETVVWHDQNTWFHFVCNPKVEMGPLKNLGIDKDMGNNIRNIWCRQIPNNFFNSLETLHIHSINGIRSSMSTSIAKNLVSLKELYIGFCKEMVEVIERDDDINLARRCLLQLEVLDIVDCESMEQVFWNEGTEDNTDGCIEFPKLKRLRLYNLPNLTAFCQGLENIILKFPNLTHMVMRGLPKLNSLSPLNSETVVGHDQNTCFHFLCNPKVKMGPLKNLTLFGLKDTNIGHIWCHQIPNNVFNNLEALYIDSMNGISSLMSTSIAKNLVSLEILAITYCEEMVEVIERDNDDKQAVDINCLFPNLRALDLWDLDKLRRFWQWNHALELPLLEDVDIRNCPVMETFTLGSINTPNISEILVNFEKIDDTKCLNDVIRHIWTQNENKDEDGYDYEEENKDDQDHFRIMSEEDEDNMIMDINNQHKIGKVSLKIKKDVGEEGEQPI